MERERERTGEEVNKETGEMNRKVRGEREKRGSREDGELINGLKDLLACQSFRPRPLPWGPSRERREERDIDLALFMLGAIGPGRRRRCCFPLCLHNEERL